MPDTLNAPRIASAVKTDYGPGDTIPISAIEDGEIFRHDKILKTWVLWSAGIDPTSPDGRRWESSGLLKVVQEQLQKEWKWGRWTYDTPARSFASLRDSRAINFGRSWLQFNTGNAIPGYLMDSVRWYYFGNDVDSIAFALYHSARTWLMFLWDQVPVDIQREMDERGMSVAKFRAAEMMKTNPNGVTLNYWFTNMQHVIVGIVDEAQYSPAWAKTGTPLERWNGVDPALAKIWDMPIKRTGSFEWFEEDPETVEREAIRQETAAKKWPGSMAYQVVYQEAIPEARPQESIVEKLTEYAPFVGIGVGLFRIFFR